jgi:glycosyltransferase involved in cell wall biosynthesis
MIVRNEVGVIERCLDSVRPFIQRWVIVDTGSTDGTQDLARQRLAELPGQLHQRPWRDFGHNRSEALALARDHADYLLVIDADEELTAEPGFRIPDLVGDMYMIPCRRTDSATTWFRATIVKAALRWRYEGAVHEYLTCDEPHVREKLGGLMVHSHPDGSRNADPQRKYATDALMLERALLDDPQNTRHVFYLAQSYRDADQPERAIARYERRVEMGGWHEEVWYAMFQIAVLKLRLRHDFPSVMAAYLRAYQYYPARAEPLCALATHFRSTREWALAEVFAREAASKPPPEDLLFVDDGVYQWRALDELAIATYYTGKLRESAELNQRLLLAGKLPASERPRIEANLAFSTGGLGGGPIGDRTRGEPLPDRADAEPAGGTAHGRAPPGNTRCIDPGPCRIESKA